MTSYRFFNFSKLRLLSWKFTPSFGFSDSTRLAVFKCISTKISIR